MALTNHKFPAAESNRYSSNLICVVVLHAVISRDQPTPLAYLLLKVTVNSRGVVTTQLNTRLSDKVQVCL